MAGTPEATVGRTFPYVSYLRAYEPLDAFDDAQQLRILNQRSRARHETEVLERSDAVRRLVRAVSDPFPHNSTDLVRVLQHPGPLQAVQHRVDGAFREIERAVAAELQPVDDPVSVDRSVGDDGQHEQVEVPLECFGVHT